jgi:conjugal transfer/entry exclusion protein
LIIVGLAAAVIAAVPGRAVALTVYDPANFSVNALQAYRSLVQITHAITQVHNQLQMLKSLDLDTVQDVREVMDAVYQISGQLGDTDAFPKDYSRLTQKHMKWLEARWIRDRRVAALHAMQVQQAMVDMMPATNARLQAVGNASRQAIGQKAALQANTQLLSQLGSQLQSLEATTVASQRLLAVREAERAAWHEYYRQRRIKIHRDDTRRFTRVRVADPFPRAR